MSFPQAVETIEASPLFDRVSDRCRARMEDLLSRLEGRASAVLSGPDGFDLTAIVEGAMSAPKLAAMSSTMIAVGDALARETGLAECSGLIVETGSGAALVHAVPVGPHKFSLMVVSKDRTLLGKLRVVTRDCAAGLAEDLERSRQSLLADGSGRTNVELG